MKMNLVLVGMMGSGKSATGRAVAEKLNWPFWDSDAEIEIIAGQSIPQVFAEKGETHFRKLEQQVLKRLCTQKECVIATGGGAVLSEANWSLWRQTSWTVWLSCPVPTLVKRLQRESDNRPLLQSNNLKETLTQLLAARKPLYEQADWKIVTSNLSPERTAEKISMQFRRHHLD